MITKLKKKINGYSRLISRITKGISIKRVHIDGLIFDVSRLPARIRGINWNEWEQDNRTIIKKYIPKDARVLELGGGLGIVSCFINKQLSDPTQHLVVEANPDMIPMIEKNGRLNSCGFTVTNKVYGEPLFFKHEDFYRSSTKSGSGEAIKVEPLSSEEMKKFNVLVSDIEGAEVDILKNENLDNFDMMILEIDRISDKTELEKVINGLKSHKKIEETSHNPAYSIMVLKKI